METFLPLQVSQLHIKLHLNDCAQWAREQFYTEYSVNVPHINQLVHTIHQGKNSQPTVLYTRHTWQHIRSLVVSVVSQVQAVAFTSYSYLCSPIPNHWACTICVKPSGALEPCTWQLKQPGLAGRLSKYALWWLLLVNWTGVLAASWGLWTSKSKSALSNTGAKH